MPGINGQTNIEQPPVSPEQHPISPEQTVNVEQQPEKAPKQVIEKTTEATTVSVVLPDDKQVSPAPIVTSAPPPEKIEAIMSEGMDNVFLSMDVATQAQFKAKGEETANQISTLLRQTKVKVRQVLDLLLGWLRIIPRVNKHYLEREAKIKADKIMDLYNKR